MKKVTSMFLACFIFCFSFSFAARGVELTYIDIDDVPWAHEAIAFFLERPMITDADRYYFYPYDEMQRGDSIIALVRYLSIKQQGAMLEEPFHDVSDENYYYSEVLIAKQEGLIFGDGKNNFHPEQTITREDFATVLYRVAQKYEIELEAKDSIEPFQDADLSDYAKEAVIKLQECGVINGYGNGCFYPQKGITRAEFVKMLYDFMKYANLLDDTEENA